tara:strand:+ start:4333 stop:4914 length:582 start_codon:yes stop_codon:yes gene_type:complete
MNMSAPVKRVVAFLEDAAFQLLPSPLIIRQSKFDFAAVMMGPGEASDIILIADTVIEKDAEIIRRIQGVARALDLARSRNPLTSILVGPRPHPEYLNKAMQVCRVLPVGTVPSGESEAKAHLSNWLAVLTPLDLIDPGGVVADPIAALRDRIEDLSADVEGLLGHVSSGSGAIEAAANDLLATRLRDAWEDDA